MTLSLVPLSTNIGVKSGVDCYASRPTSEVDKLLASALCIELTIVCYCADSSTARTYELVFPSPADSMTAHELARGRARELIKVPSVVLVNLSPLAEQLPIGLTAQLTAMHNAVLFSRAQSPAVGDVANRHDSAPAILTQQANS